MQQHFYLRATGVSGKPLNSLSTYDCASSEVQNRGGLWEELTDVRPPAPVAPLSKERSELYVHPKRRTAAEVAALLST